MARRSEQSSGPDRSTPPVVGPPVELALPGIERSALSNGLDIWLVELHEIPLVQVNLLVLTGSGDDPPGRFGVADLMATMLDEGAGDRSALELADAVEFLGGTLRTGNSFDGMSVRLNVPVSQISEGLGIMADVAMRPTFPALDLERVREERLTDLRQRRDDPTAIVGPAFDRVIFGPEHRYGTGLVGTPSTLSIITRDDLVDFYDGSMQPANSVVFVVGNTTMTEIRPLLEEHFGGWSGTGPVRRQALPTTPQRTAREVFLLDVPGAAQSQIRIGGPGVSRSTPDYFPLQVVNTVLGGSFSSRLNQNLREEQGYTYGAGSGFQMRRSQGAFLAVAGVETGTTADALREFFLELEGIRQPIPDDELARAKKLSGAWIPWRLRDDPGSVRKAGRVGDLWPAGRLLRGICPNDSWGERRGRAARRDALHRARPLRRRCGW